MLWNSRIILLAPVLLGFALGNWNDTSTGIDLDKLPRFPLSEIRSGFLQAGSRVTFDGVTATAPRDVREVQLRGVGRSGKRWEAHLCCLDEVWRGDLDGNGTQDYVLFGSGPYFNGRTTPVFSLSILLMDKQGLPVPFFTVLYQGERGNGIKHLVDLDHRGRAELLISTYDEARSDPLAGTFCSGHWVTQAYQFTGLRLEEIRGTAGQISFPFVHDWTYGPKCYEQDRPMTVQPPDITEHGNGRAREVTTLLREIKEDGWLTIDAVAGCEAIHPDTVVYDRGKIREIGFPSLFTSYTFDLAERIRRDGVPVRISGINKRDHGHCGANLMWASK